VLYENGNYSGIGVQAINEGMRQSSRYPPAWTVGAGCEQAPATDFFMNPDP